MKKFSHWLLVSIIDFPYKVFSNTRSIWEKSPKNWNHGEKGNVVIIPGYAGKYCNLATIAEFLNNKGYRIIPVPKVNSTDKIEVIKNQIINYIKKHKLNKLYFLAHSKGGLITKIILDENKDIFNNTILAFTIATPYKGTLFGNINMRNVDELSQNSRIIEQLNKSNVANSKIINIYSKTDDVIIPNESMYLKGAKANIMIDELGHNRILENRDTLKVIEKYIK